MRVARLRNFLLVTFRKVSTIALLCETLLFHHLQGQNPGPRWGHAFVYDEVRQEVVLFGGAKARREYIGDIWTWDGNQWKHHAVPGPPARGFSAATFHAGRRTVMIHGGRGSENVTYADTWEWDGTSWTQVSSDQGYRADHHEMVYLPQQDQLLAFGGWNGKDVIGETWLWSGTWEKYKGNLRKSDRPSE